MFELDQIERDERHIKDRGGSIEVSMIERMETQRDSKTDLDYGKEELTD